MKVRPVMSFRISERVDRPKQFHRKFGKLAAAAMQLNDIFEIEGDSRLLVWRGGL
jgi:hypothetical protein